MYINMFAAFAIAFSENAMDVPSNDLTELLGRKSMEVKNFLSGIFSTTNN